MTSEVNHAALLDVVSLPETSTSGMKRKREGNKRSIVWQHFTKLEKKEGEREECRCDHCHKTFSCSAKSGTTHLLRHITEGICPVFKKSGTILRSTGQSSEAAPWKFGLELGQSPTQQFNGVQDKLLPQVLEELEHRTCNTPEGYGDQSPAGNTLCRQQSHEPVLKPGDESWMCELTAYVNRLVELTNHRNSKENSVKSCETIGPPDYSLAAALRCLNRMEDIPQSSEMYLDAFEILRDATEREAFICLNPEPRRRWLQRMLYQRYPSHYNYGETYLYKDRNTENAAQTGKG